MSPTPTNPTPTNPITPSAPGISYPCSICGEPATDICSYCTKDACANHRCEKCQRCSDCCQCELRRAQS